MSRSHEEPLRSNNFQKVTPRRVKSARCFSSLHLFLSSSLKVDLIYPELCLLLDKTHTHTHTHRKTCWGLWKHTSWACRLIFYRDHHRVIGWTAETIMQRLISTVYIFSLIVSSICGLVQVRRNTQHSVHIVGTEQFSFLRGTCVFHIIVQVWFLIRPVVWALVTMDLNLALEMWQDCIMCQGR